MNWHTANRRAKRVDTHWWGFDFKIGGFRLMTRKEVRRYYRIKYPRTTIIVHRKELVCQSSMMRRDANATD